LKANANPGVKAAAKATRRARMKNAADPMADHSQIAAIYALAEKLTKLTGSVFHVDHIRPISKGGKHHQDNLVVMTGELNMRKHAQHWPWLYWFNS
jgi:5-methylcytosine-specific restriction endonuclease McrA